jgi:hypothetical protein
MTTTVDCQHVAECLEAYLDKSLSRQQMAQIDTHLLDCEACRESVRCSRAVHGLLEYVQMDPRDAQVEEELQGEGELQEVGAEEGQPEEVASVSLLERFGAAPWWCVSALVHVLLIALASLVTMAIDMPKGDDAVIMVTELQQRVAPQAEQEKPKQELRDALSSKHDTPPTDITSKEASDIVVPPDILAKAELGDHFETINPDLPDSHSAFGNPEAKMFHSVEGNAEPEGGGGMNGIGMEDLVGVGGAASKGTGGGFGGGDGTGIGVGTGAGKGSFGQRNGGGRKLMVRRHGGSKATENAVDKALQWLAYHQEADGHWDCAKYGGKPHDTFATGIALLTFLGAGHTEKVGQYKDNVKNAVAWLKSKQKDDGMIGVSLGYEVAVATMAMSEAAGMANVKETREAAQKAINYCIDKHQQGEGSEKGAWRYSPKAATADLSVTGWFVMALKSGKVAGLHVDPAAFEGAIKFLDHVQSQQNGPKVDTAYGPVVAYGYTDPGAGERTSAIGNLCRQFMGWKKEDLQGSVQFFVDRFGVPKPEKFDLYYWYYGTLCTFQQGGDIWKNWNEAMKNALLPIQCKDGDNAGSWDPQGHFSEQWGRVSQTAISCLCLEVYYRYLQLTPDQK